MTAVIVAGALLAVGVLCFACLKVASDADDKAEKYWNGQCTSRCKGGSTDV